MNQILPKNTQKRRFVLGITGATGSIYAVRLLRALRDTGNGLTDIETHVVISPSGVLNVKYELGMTRHEIHALADAMHSWRDIGSALASGGVATLGMLIAPCSMRTLAAVAHGLSDNLITRAADVTLKERRRLVMMVRETPLNLAHLRNMTAVTEMGGVIFPPLPAFYHHPKTIEEMVDHTLARVMDLFGVELPGPRWEGA